MSNRTGMKETGNWKNVENQKKIKTQSRKGKDRSLISEIAEQTQNKDQRKLKRKED